MTIALFIALTVLIFRDVCTLTAEVIVILIVISGGHFVATFNVEDAERTEISWSKMRGLDFPLYAMGQLSQATSAWFWVRLAAVGERDFIPTPGGATSLFFFARLRGEQFRLASRSMAFFSIWSSTTVLWLGATVALLDYLKLTKLVYLATALSWEGIAVMAMVAYSSLLFIILPFLVWPFYCSERRWTRFRHWYSTLSQGYSGRG